MHSRIYLIKKMKAKAQRKSNGKAGKQTHRDKLQKFRDSVNNFVKSKGGFGESESDQRGIFVKRKSRKELRKEKRKLKKAKKKSHNTGQSLPNPSEEPAPNTPAEEEVKTQKPAQKTTGHLQNAAQRQQKTNTDNVHIKDGEEETTKRKVHFSEDLPKQRKTASLNESRKRVLLEANIEEDKVIKRLEKRLGLNKRKNKKSLPQSFTNDGLDYILGILEPGNKDDSEDEDDTDEEEGDGEDDTQMEEEEDVEDDTQIEDEVEGDEDEEDTDASEENDEEEEKDSQQKTPESQKPNPATAGKYVPPHLREAVDSKRKAELEKLKRTVKGLINRLLMEHILLVSVLHFSVGLEVGAHFLETVVRQFDKTYSQLDATDKECDNLMSIIAHLYNFHVVHALLVFDILKKLVTRFSAKDVELVLLVLKNVGFALRKDDPLALKELISEAQRKANAEGERFQDQTRIRFMLETMLALKNNDMRKIPGYDPEPVEKLRKLQRTLIHSSAGGSDLKLRVSLDNLLEAERVGRWWIVGSSWSGAPMIDDHGNKTTSPSTKGEQLARKQRMNTDIRRNIFCVLMSSEDYLDAFEKLLRLGLKDQQEREIVHVLMDCCLQEKMFNRFYAVLAETFSSHDRRFQVEWKSIFKMTRCAGHPETRCAVIHLKLLVCGLVCQYLPVCLPLCARISGIPKLGMLREGLKLFISHFLLRNIQTQETEQAKVLRDRAEVATKAVLRTRLTSIT
uniref:Nucleolar MIF4G domain-containing protein 1 n=1 Tax=Sinocyclocheilus grahami TaxID=75366 RepID=A0A672L6Z6_SINGR